MARVRRFTMLVCALIKLQSVSFVKLAQPLLNYKERWQIETMFKAIKSRGFNLEDIHLTDLKGYRS